MHSNFSETSTMKFRQYVPYEVEEWASLEVVSAGEGKLVHGGQQRQTIHWVTKSLTC